ncbi:MAG: hypothetical protein L0I80_06080 [Brevibacterium sp.]|uniref:hypothetical protein n=1 Tax=Brevibacterium sp. TaxID=1701 RepID=UPI0026497267|nr:hypothetical protein [Brevibacterium sp.]MDN5806989.1 hypothetical protein [Brevibacterium sp.]MDN5832955.1 hypothetical protein [Brevibacterium sp.]MDN5875278.1 hypothetical protein [Brevibacterium sp.]MDN5908375.1 hypothetical protein [Brevibacterium sp.]MDN6123427.1 hypothetical protein [Brevibacterium sp.]
MDSVRRPACRISRVSHILGIICAFIGGWALLCGLGVLVFGGVLFAAISSADPGNTSAARPLVNEFRQDRWQ